MAGNFDFLAEKFPELAENGRKAEKYLYADNEVCMFFISRIFDNAVKYICSFNDVAVDGTKLAEPINELFQKKAVDESIYLLLEMMRTFRNGNAHNKDYSLNDSMILLQMSHILCEWLMTEYGQTGYQRKGFMMPVSENLGPGSVVECTVNIVRSYGVLVSAGEMHGLLHKSEIPSGSTKGYNVGDKITAKILSVDAEKGHAVLSISRLFPERAENSPQEPAELSQVAGVSSQDSGVSAVSDASLQDLNAARPPAPKNPPMSDEQFLQLCTTGSPQKIQAAISNGANVNAVNSKGRTALMMAAMKNSHPEVIELLLNSGAEPNSKSKKGVSALTYAEANKHLQNTTALGRLRSLAGQQPKKSVMTPAKFIAVCSSATPAQIAAAIKKGININAPHSNGITPLMAAARSNEPTAVNVLLNAGASIKPKDSSGRTALDWAKTNPKLQNSKILKHL